MDKETIKDVLLLQSKRKKESSIPRSILKNIREQRATPFIIIISGVRRCGKSTLLGQIKTDECYYVNFDDERFVGFKVSDFQLLYESLVELFGEKEIFLFDEIQNIRGWERFVRRLHDEKKKVYVTGSNASMLSRELGTHLTGRNITFKLYPFSFKEFLDLKGYKAKALDKLTSLEKSSMNRLFREYLEEGGFPEYLQTNKEEYLKNVYENIIYRDIITRYNLTSEKPLKETAYFAASNIGKEISFNTIRKLTGLTSATTIKEYFEYLENSYLVFLIPRYDFSLKKQAYYNKKAFFIDPAMARIIGFRPSRDKGRILENSVFISLKRRNHEVFFHKGEYECDFLLRKGTTIAEAIQVAYAFGDREVHGLLEAMEKHKLTHGLILTMDEEKEISKGRKRITVQPAWKWMLENE